MTSRRRKKVRAFAVAVVITLVLGACTGDDAGASQGTTKLANRTTGPTETGPTETGPAETGPAETGPTQTAPPAARASAAPDVVRQRTCSDGARSRLELTDMGDRIKVRFEVSQSPVGHEWRIRLRFVERNIFPVPKHVFFRGTRVASDSGVFVVQLRVPDWRGVDGVDAKAVERLTGQECKAFSWGA
jgi:hypothetical protein